MGLKSSTASEIASPLDAAIAMAPQRKSFPRLFLSRSDPFRLTGERVFLRAPERGDWEAWASLRAGGSPIDYVRPTGSGGDSLILTAGQPGRRSRLWWRNVLNQFGASDVISPVARLERQWPGGPVRGTFTCLLYTSDAADE